MDAEMQPTKNLIKKKKKKNLVIVETTIKNKGTGAGGANTNANVLSNEKRIFRKSSDYR